MNTIDTLIQETFQEYPAIWWCGYVVVLICAIALFFILLPRKMRGGLKL